MPAETSPRAVRALIGSMVREIVRQFKPEQIILFGSHARGDARPDSDVDLLVIMAGAHSKREAQFRIRRALDRFDISKDIVVTTPEDFARRKSVPGTVERPAALEGRSLYVRP